MTAMDATFGTFNDGGDLVVNDIVVGLRNGVNTRFSFQGQAPGVYLLLTGGTMSGGINMDGNAIINLPLPTNADDAANKAYVDATFAPIALTNTHIYVGNGSNVATDVALSGDATLANTGALTLANTAVAAATYTVNGSNLFTVDSKGRLTSASDITVTSAPSGAAGGDLSGSYPNPSVAKLQGHAVKNALPTDAQLLVWNNTNTDWEPVSMSSDATLDNTGALTLANTAVTPASYTINGSALFTVDSKGRLTSASNATVTAAPSGSAGGDLSGTYPNPTVAKINGVALGSTTATSGNLLIGSGTTWATQAVSNDATISNTGALTLANTAVTPGSYTVNGLASYTVDSKGRLTAAANLTIAAGTNITVSSVGSTITINATATGTTSFNDIMLLMGG